MRLTDKDALEEAVQGAINIMEAHGISMIAASVPLAIIKGAPTVDAIPVDWLKNVRKDEWLSLDDVELIDLILAWWQKEQEEK